MNETFTTLLTLTGAGFGLGIGAYFGVQVASALDELFLCTLRKMLNFILKLRGKRHAD
ncbi:hypothetical protein HG263_21680 [Pseudoalteromonas sp. JBTF-M23]|uniref:Uncharacterized protein n=1 Tax=Pseudoalteromonas caenipelagi TaxID=2726988 RepID=A0A849VIH8_9GAMM|nr:hypothetical protein [Pseudoalteromonas caenipelagi]NOU53115.1 hypothetical protein [Pseudoalteromonas caenipelagi]